MWLVRWFGREDPDPRPRWLETECATFSSASGLAHRLSYGDAKRISVKRIGETPTPRSARQTCVLPSDRAPRAVIDAPGEVCRHELRRGSCVLCR